MWLQTAGTVRDHTADPFPPHEDSGGLWPCERPQGRQVALLLPELRDTGGFQVLYRGAYLLHRWMLYGKERGLLLWLQRIRLAHQAVHHVRHGKSVLLHGVQGVHHARSCHGISRRCGAARGHPASGRCPDPDARDPAKRAGLF